MILIVSERDDNSTSRVIEFLKHYSLPVLRVNYGDDLHVIDGIISNKKLDFLFSVNGNQFRYSDVDFYWYRRGAFYPRLSFRNGNLYFLKEMISRDLEGYEYFFNDLFIKKCNSIGDSRKNKLNKLSILLDAMTCGIDVPDTFITSRKSSFPNKRIISKGVFNTTRFSYNNTSYGGGTTEVNVATLPKEIALTSVQERIDKEYEIRSFYLKGKFFNIAILSQSNPKTIEDFRNYDREKPNRTVPCEIPVKLKTKLSELYAMNGLDTCSTDIVKTVDGKYVLLDINPVGQFGMTSHPTNFMLEREIALHIKKCINE